ncbi:hypothetical protein [Chitinophaga ginsengisegetis]|uniref:hypothetical protein n=1 Tax=Chitinophaga ginsengisegetis TaxID=393003 RepID=UPI000DB973FC|nr:hypothetical protein [Chitinophaga ginsengisegetis]MDR6567446.1 hypothetical protein [Chitinophaga ginsengisegetis]MDR6647177.1 hypothetical protein [Chitinophaga ginsengisegetis]MDR6653526.1 hypothetical protein [Chitinophaga ginsengisegetis]
MYSVIEGVTFVITLEKEIYNDMIVKEASPNSETGFSFEANLSVDRNSFWHFIVGNPSNRLFLGLSILVTVIQFLVFKYYYPFAGYINGDSYVYLETAYHNLNINTYPIGYSKFLRLFSVFTRSDYALVAVQYLFLQTSFFALVFTLFFFYNPKKVTRVLLLGSMILNPVSLYLANYISSDCFFLSLSIVWFTQLLWTVYRPTNRLIFFNALILFIAFTVRYNALYYPIIALIALVLSRDKLLMKALGICLGIGLIVCFVLFTSNEYKKLSGKSQFSPFTGWQMANNALYAYRFVDSTHHKKVPSKLKELDDMVRNYFDTTRDVQKNPQEKMIASTVYMWDPRSPLTIYMDRKFKTDSTASTLKKWAAVAPTLSEYGSFLVHQYPVEFTKYYIIPNALKYYCPPVEFLETYSTGVDSVNYIAQAWFGYKDNKVRSRFKDFKVNVLNFYPIIVGIMNVVLLFSLISFFLLKGYRQFPFIKSGLILATSLWIINFGFSVLASPIALRFQLFPIIVSFVFTVLLIEIIFRLAAKGDEDAVMTKDPEIVEEYRDSI